MTSIVDTFVEAAKADTTKNALLHQAAITMDAGVLTNHLVGSWGATIAEPKASPSLQRLRPSMTALGATNATLKIVLNEDGIGAFEHNLSPGQKQAFIDMRDTLTEAAVRASVPQERLEQAQAGFDARVERLSMNQLLAVDEGKIAIATLIDAYEGSLKKIDHIKLGEIDMKALHAMGEVLPAKVADIENEAANPTPLTGVARYRSLGEIVKANDAESLTKVINDTIEAKLWDETRQDQATELLVHASQMGHVEVVKVLIDLGKAEIDATDKNGHSSIHMAAAADKPEMIEFLVKRGAKVDQDNIDGHTPLMLAAENDAVSAIERLHALGANLDKAALNGLTALHHAAQGVDGGDTAQKAVAKLLELGANPSLKDALQDAYPEELVDEKADDTYSALTAARKRWESGQTTPQAPSLMSKARSALGI